MYAYWQNIWRFLNYVFNQGVYIYLVAQLSACALSGGDVIFQHAVTKSKSSSVDDSTELNEILITT